MAQFSKKKRINSLTVFGVCFFIIVLFSPNAFGYIDGGTGSYLVQFAMAGFFAALFTLKNFIRVLFLKVLRHFHNFSGHKHN
jgi:hypothetical protein